VSGSGEKCFAEAKNLAEKLTANCGVPSGTMVCLPLRTTHCFNFVSRLISLFLLFHINQIHWMNTQTE